MSESPETLPEAVVEEKSGFSLVWLVPLVAALIGGWVAWSAYSERGPAIEIRFDSAEGLEAGKTLVLYKNVQVGKVESISLSEDLEHVDVTVRMVADAEPYLTSKTRFWVARARVSATQITDVGTLLSGAYIGIDPSYEGTRARSFDGLEVPPVVTSEEEGLHLVLHGKSLGSLDVGAPVYYRSVEVGRLIAANLDEDGQGVTLRAFIKAEHEGRVHTGTHFWNVSGIDVSMGPDGVHVDTPSLTSMLIGGIAFDTPEGAALGKPVKDGAVFELYPNRQASEQARYRLRARYLLDFDQSVAGLVRGAPVTFRGITIGEVEEVGLVYDVATEQVQIPVQIVVQPERIRIQGGQRNTSGERMEALVAHGMRAQLTSVSLITGALGIGFDFHPGAAPAKVIHGGRYPRLPTVPSSMAEITGSVERIVGRLEKLPIDDIGKNLDSALRELSAMLATLNEDVSPALAGSLTEAEQALGAINGLVASDSASGQELRRMLIDLGETVRSLRRLVAHLEAQPEDLLRGRKE